MTILIVAQSANRVVLASDTRAIRYPDGVQFETPKLFATPHMAVTGAGSIAVPLSMLGAASSLGWTYDQAVANGAALMSDIMRRVEAEAAAAGAQEVFGRQLQSLVIAGYSMSAGRMAACAFLAAMSEPQDIEGLAYMPGGEGLPALGTDASDYVDGDFMDMACKLVARCNEIEVNSAGGHLHLVSIERDRATLRDVGEIARMIS